METKVVILVEHRKTKWAGEAMKVLSDFGIPFESAQEHLREGREFQPGQIQIASLAGLKKYKKHLGNNRPIRILVPETIGELRALGTGSTGGKGMFVALDGGANAALAAVQILALTPTPWGRKLASALSKFRRKQTQLILKSRV